MIAYDLRFLLAVMNWATITRDSRACVLLEKNPLRGLMLPREQSPRRPIVSSAEYERLLAVAAKVHPLFRLALVLARETGHRIGAIRQLRWSDVNLEAGRMVWRGECDKIGMEHGTILSEEAGLEIRSARAEQGAIGDTWMFTDSERPDGVVSRHQLRKWWERAAKLADLPSGQRVGWHSLRRQWATDMKSFPLKDIAALGGWKDTRTLLECYIQPDEGTMRTMLASRARAS